MKKETIVTVFGSSHGRAGETNYEAARALGRALAISGLAVCTGGYGGVMEGVSRGAKEAGGKTYGVTAECFATKPNEWIEVEVRMHRWEERLFELIRLADGFVACEGGTGTLAELAVVWEMMNKSLMERKPFVTVGNYWSPILERMRGSDTRTGARSGGEFIEQMRTPDEAVRYLKGKLS